MRQLGGKVKLRTVVSRQPVNSSGTNVQPYSSFPPGSLSIQKFAEDHGLKPVGIYSRTVLQQSHP